MRDRGIIWSALAIFVALITLPVWHNLGASVTGKGPTPVLPAKEKQCVAPTAYMKSSHMRLLLDWRENVVRGNTREFVTPDGRHFNMSLTSTCLKQCHGAKGEFCDRCHNYAAVSAPCWNCHVDSKAVLWSSR
jgi:hypothetical protein